MSYQTLIPNIKALIENVAAVRNVYEYPLDGFPAEHPSVIFFPSSFDNAYETTADNKKRYSFDIYIEVSVAGTTIENVFTSVLPNVVDDVIAQFDENWNGGTLDGHRIWYTISSGEWGRVVNDKADLAFAQLNLTVELMTTN